MLTHAHTYAHVCSRMLTYADVCGDIGGMGASNSCLLSCEAWKGWVKEGVEGEVPDVCASVASDDSTEVRMRDSTSSVLQEGMSAARKAADSFHHSILPSSAGWS